MNETNTTTPTTTVWGIFFRRAKLRTAFGSRALSLVGNVRALPIGIEHRGHVALGAVARIGTTITRTLLGGHNQGYRRPGNARSARSRSNFVLVHQVRHRPVRSRAPWRRRSTHSSLGLERPVRSPLPVPLRHRREQMWRIRPRRLAVALDVARHDRGLTGHAFEQDHPETLAPGRRRDQHVGPSQATLACPCRSRAHEK
jgi:hypothetical protein